MGLFFVCGKLGTRQIFRTGAILKFGNWTVFHRGSGDISGRVEIVSELLNFDRRLTILVSELSIVPRRFLSVPRFRPETRIESHFGASKSRANIKTAGTNKPRIGCA